MKKLTLSTLAFLICTNAFAQSSATSQATAPTDAQIKESVNAMAASQAVNKDAPRWVGLVVADVPFFQKTMTPGLQTIYKKIVAPVSPNKSVPMIQHISDLAKNAYSKQREIIANFIKKSIILDPDVENLNVQQMHAGKEGERFDFSVGDKKYEAFYYAYNHVDTGATILTCLAFVKANGKVHVYFAQADQTDFPKCKDEFLDLFTSVNLWPASKSTSGSTIKVKESKKVVANEY